MEKTFITGKTKIFASDIYSGEFVAIMGPNGSGKSTNIFAKEVSMEEEIYYLNYKADGSLGNFIYFGCVE